MLKKEGFLLCPEGAATYAAFKKGLADGKIKKTDRVLLFNAARIPGRYAAADLASFSCSLRSFADSRRSIARRSLASAMRASMFSKLCRGGIHEFID